MIGKISLCLALGSQVLVGMAGPAVCSEGWQGSPCHRARGSKFQRETSEGQGLGLLNPLNLSYLSGEIF